MRRPTHGAVYWLARVFVRIGFFLCGGRVYGRKNVPRKGKVIIAPNHRSNLDPPVINSLIPRKIIFSIAKIELFEGFGSWLMPRLNCIPVNRAKPDRDFFRAVSGLFTDNSVLLIFPEGTRSNEDVLLQFKIGAAHFSKTAEAPIVPCRIEGKRVWFGEPINPSKHTKDSLSDELYQAVTKLGQS